MKIGDIIKYDGVKVVITDVNFYMISLEPYDKKKNPDDYYYNIPLNECRPGRNKTNIELIEKCD